MKPDADAWEGVWVPPMVRAGWQGTNLAAYETDFYHNIVQSTPRFRQVVGEGEAFLAGIDAACAARGMTAQLCAGNPHSFLEALTMPTITNARASIDYDWDGDPAANSGPRSNNGAHNWAAADNGYVFWATRVAPSKDNFWSSWRDLSPLGYGADSGRNGMDAELHALGAVLSTGPVGLGDYTTMVNATLVRRLVRADGILLRPDRPLAPVDAQWGALVGGGGGSGGGGGGGGALHAMPGLCTLAQEKQGPTASCGARLWQTHATVAAENAAAAPELAAAPTRTLVSHSGVDATRIATVTASLAAAAAAAAATAPPVVLLQHLVVSVDQNASFVLQRADLYPAIAPDATVLWRSAQDGGAPCVAGSDAVASGCLAVGDTSTGALFDVSTQRSPCSQGGTFGRARSGACMHSVDVWQVFVAPPNATSVFLGDLGAYVSLSGYRFRLAPGGDATMVAVVGQPEEAVAMSWAAKKGDGSWVVQAKDIVIGATGREVVAFAPDDATLI